MLYLIHGDDTYSARDEVARIRNAALPADDVFNYATIDAARGGKPDDLFDQIVSGCEAVPFLADRRVVVVSGLLARLGKGAAAKGGMRERFIAYADERLPATTDLIIYEAPAKVAASDPVLKLATKRGKVIECAPLRGIALERWIVARARSQNYAIAPDAVALLTSIGEIAQSDLHRLANELDKLAAYAGGESITHDMVTRLTPETHVAANFGLTNAIAERKLDEALLQLRLMAEESDLAPREFYSKTLQLMVWQIQTLIKIKTLKDNGRYGKDEIAGRLGLNPYVVQKTLPLVQRFSADHLANLYHQLADLDYRNKTGRVELGTALDVFLHDACKAPAVVHGERRQF